eukprot:1203046-Lingulodinium_polyedra.AAC.1
MPLGPSSASRGRAWPAAPRPARPRSGRAPCAPPRPAPRRGSPCRSRSGGASPSSSPEGQPCTRPLAAALRQRRGAWCRAGFPAAWRERLRRFGYGKGCLSEEQVAEARKELDHFADEQFAAQQAKCDR